MKKASALLLSLLLFVTLCACGQTEQTKPEETATTTTITTTTEPTAAITTTANQITTTTVPSRITAAEARELYAAWQEDHTEAAEYTLSEANETYEWQGGQYHLFHAEKPDWYWYNILVHMETGELLFMMTPDGEDPETTVEPLNDWYDTTFAP